MDPEMEKIREYVRTVLCRRVPTASIISGV